MEANDNDRLEELEALVQNLEGELEEARANETQLEAQLAEIEIDDKEFIPNTGEDEPPFRAAVRDLLSLDWSARDEKIYDELRRLKHEDSH